MIQKSRRYQSHLSQHPRQLPSLPRRILHLECPPHSYTKGTLIFPTTLLESLPPKISSYLHGRTRLTTSATTLLQSTPFPRTSLETYHNYRRRQYHRKLLLDPSTLSCKPT